MKKMLSLLAAAAAVLSCGMTAALAQEHEPITIMDANRDYTKLIELVHETYPEINIEIEAYKGRNTSAYMKRQLETGSMPDIYCTTQAWDNELQKEHLVDLSQYAVSELYNQVRLNEYDVEGGIYLLPYDYNIIGITYNKSLLERNNIAVPTSFAQLRDETIPALNAAGIEISNCLVNLPGSMFQFFFQISRTEYTNTLEGRAWLKNFVNGDAVASEGLRQSVELFQKWIDCGMVNMNYGKMEDRGLTEHFAQGNTAFWLGMLSRFTQNSDGTGDEYALMPYLSEDGTHNVYITQISRAYGLSKELEKPGNEQKLEDALHVLEIMSTNEGYAALIGDISSSMCAIKEFKLPEDSAYASAIPEINDGYCAPLIYVGWDDYLVPFGEAVCSWVLGESTGEQALQILDNTKREKLAQGVKVYTTVTEELNTEQAARLSGQMFLEATGADAALISYNIYQPEVLSNMENGYGANGRILIGEMSEEDITIFLPTGWYDTLQVATLPGARIKELAKVGCDLRDNGHPYPYVFMTKDGEPLEDDAEYMVVICGYSKAHRDDVNFQDTGIVGLDAAKAYLEHVDELSSQTLDESLVQHVE